MKPSMKSAVQVVVAIHRVDVERPLALEELAVGDDGPLVVDNDVSIVAAQHVDVRRHVHQMARVRHQVAQVVARTQRALRERRHLHQVDVEVQQAGMRPRGRKVLEALLQHFHRLGRAGVLGDAPGPEIPHLPGRLIHDRVGEHRAHVEIVAIFLEHRPHRRGEGLVPRRLVFDRLALRVADEQCMDQRLLDRGRAGRMLQGVLHGVIGRRQRHRLAGGIEQLPGQIVVGTRGIGDAPVRHGAARVVLQRLAEALDRFPVVEGEGPDQAAIEPQLRLGRRRRDRPAVLAEIVVGHGSPLPPPHQMGRCRHLMPTEGS
jgi:hypothetical protein